MDAALGVALINGVFGMLILIGGIVLNNKVRGVTLKVDETRKAVHETKREVKNSHEINFRDDIDSKFLITNNLIREVQTDMAMQARATTQVRINLANHIASTLDRENQILAMINSHHPG